MQRLIDDEDRKADELVIEIDRLISAGTGHINVSGDSGTGFETHTLHSVECNGNMACCVPTLHKGIDDKENGKE